MKHQPRISDHINWEWVHSHHPASAGKITSKSNRVWLGAIRDHAKRNGWIGTVSTLGLIRIVNAHLY